MKKLVLVFALLLALLGCTTESRRAAMRGRLSALNALNRADSVLTARERDEALSLVDFFDRHGTANEQMLAHYLLGRCYADMHEAPMALHCYQEAISRADTLSSDCDFAQLSRVYGQSATIFYQQGLYRNALEYDDLCTDYGWRGKDALTALSSYAMKAASYDQLQQKDSAILIYKDAIRQLRAYNYYKVAAGFSGTLAKKLIDKDKIAESESYMLDYERHSGYFDPVGNIASGREIYYYWKGLYYLKRNQLDSAKYYFRKELRLGKDFGNQNSGSRRLAQLFLLCNQPDSAAKYALYAYDMNDSVYAQRAMREVEQAKAMYDYSRHQELAQQKELEASRERSLKERIVYLSLVLLCLLGGALAMWIRKKKDYRTLLTTHQEAEKELSTLYQLQSDYLSSEEQHIENESRLNELVIKKEKEVERLRSTIKKSRRDLRETASRNAEAMARMKQSEEYQNIQKRINRGDTFTADDCEQLEKLMSEYFPKFYAILESKRDSLNPNKYLICLFARLDVNPKRISMLLGIHPSYVSKAREQMHELFFKTKGTAKDFDEKLNEI